MTIGSFTLEHPVVSGHKIPSPILGQILTIWYIEGLFIKFNFSNPKMQTLGRFRIFWAIKHYVQLGEVLEKSILIGLKKRNCTHMPTHPVDRLLPNYVWRSSSLEYRQLCQIFGDGFKGFDSVAKNLNFHYLIDLRIAINTVLRYFATCCRLYIIFPSAKEIVFAFVSLSIYLSAG